MSRRGQKQFMKRLLRITGKGKTRFLVRVIAQFPDWNIKVRHLEHQVGTLKQHGLTGLSKLDSQLATTKGQTTRNVCCVVRYYSRSKK